MSHSSLDSMCSYFIKKSKDIEVENVFEAKAWLLTGRCMIPTNYQIQLQSYLLEKRQRNPEACARCFESLFRVFPMDVIEEVNDIANAVKAVTLNDRNAKEPGMKATEDEQFLANVFNALPVGMRMELLMHRSEHNPVLVEKCHTVLLMVKLFPDVINQHGCNMLYTLSGCDADVTSEFRSHLVTELVPAVLCKNLHPSPALATLLNQCIEYYVLVPNPAGCDPNDPEDRWEKLNGIVDQIGSILKWSVTPFFRDSSRSSGRPNVEALYQSLYVVIQHQNRYNSPTELAYIALVVFLRCVTSYYEKLSMSGSWKFGEKSRLALVEVFIPSVASQRSFESNVLTTVSSCPSINCDSPQLLSYFTTATKVWQLINSVTGERVKKELFNIIGSMPSLKLDKWNVFQEFEFDYKSYFGKHKVKETGRINSNIKLASMHCRLKNYKIAADYAIKVVNEINNNPATPTIGGASVTSPPVDSKTIPSSRSRTLSGSVAAAAVSKKLYFSFYNCQAYSTDSQGQMVPQRRVHFISEHKSEVLLYATNVLVQCFQSVLENVPTQDKDMCIGHLMTLLQLEWYSPVADSLLTEMLDMIRRRGSFRYFPYFNDFIIEGDILEQFMALANIEPKPLTLEIFSASPGNGNTGNVTSSRRMGTRGVERGVKNDFKLFMKKQMIKNAQENLETLLIRFLTQSKIDILLCFD